MLYKEQASLTFALNQQAIPMVSDLRALSYLLAAIIVIDILVEPYTLMRRACERIGRSGEEFSVVARRVLSLRKLVIPLIVRESSSSYIRISFLLMQWNSIFQIHILSR